MGLETILPPIVGGLISLSVWRIRVSHENSRRFMDHVGKIERCVTELTQTAERNKSMLELQHEDMKQMRETIQTIDRRLWDLNDRGSFR